MLKQLISIDPAENIGKSAKPPGSPVSKSSDVSFLRSGLPRAFGFNGDFRQCESLLRIGDLLRTAQGLVGVRAF